MKLHLSENHRIILGTALIGIAGLGLLVLALYHHLLLSGLNTELFLAQGDLTSGRARLAYLQDLQAKEGPMRDAVEEYRLLLPEGISQEEIFLTMQELCDRHEVSLRQLSIGEAQSDQAVGRLPLDLSLEGDYQNVMELLEDLTTEGRLTLLDRVELTVRQPDQGSVSAAASAVLYYEPLKS